MQSPEEHTMKHSGVVVASIWRFREMKRKIPRQKDKELISYLQDQNARVTAELKRWWDWYFFHQQHEQQPDRWRAEREEEGVDVSTEGAERSDKRASAGLALQQQQRCIDYTKWEHLSCYSSSSDRGVLGEEEEEEKEEGEDEEEDLEDAGSDAEETEADAELSWHELAGEAFDDEKYAEEMKQKMMWKN